MNRRRILVIDDSPTSTRMTRLMIQRIGHYEVRELNDAHQAMEAAREFRPDLILLDVCMPNIEGSEVAERFANDPDFADTPLIFLTCIVTPGEAGETGSRVIGRHEYIAKPARPEKLVASIEGNLTRARRTPGTRPVSENSRWT
ncbi:MAG: response regulator [Verrucomicrobiia bacterium]|jgi:two-component system cell cycle response regulator